METHGRTLFKTMSWRFIAISVTIIISYAWLDDFKSSLVIGLGANSIKVVAYYIHERAWNAVAWGRVALLAREQTEVSPASAEMNIQQVRAVPHVN